MLERGLRELPEEQRRVVVMRDMEGYVHGEVAERLGIPEGNGRVPAAHRPPPAAAVPRGWWPKVTQQRNKDRKEETR